jgi:hypothetical protein
VLREASDEDAPAVVSAPPIRSGGQVSGYAGDTGRARRPSEPVHLGGPGNGGPDVGGGPITTEALVAHLRRLEQTLIPAVSAEIDQRPNDPALPAKMAQILSLLEQLTFRLTPRR